MASTAGTRLPMRAPKQARSRATAQRILDAALTLLEEKTFEEVAVAEIASRARSSVGAFYARFPDKDALLDQLEEAYVAGTVRAIDGFAAERKARPLRLAPLVAAIVEHLVAHHRRHRGLIRALLVRERARRATRTPARHRSIGAKLPVLLDLVLSCRGEIRHPAPRRASATAFTIAVAALRESILFPETLAGPRLADTALARELARTCLACLGAQPTSPGTQS